MCTFNIVLNDKVVDNARKSFRDDRSMTQWIEEQVTVLLNNYMAVPEQKSRNPHKHDALMGVISDVSDSDYKRIHLREKYGI